MAMRRSGIPGASPPDQPTRPSGGIRDDARVGGTDPLSHSGWLDSGTQPIDVTANHPWSPVTITTSVPDSHRGPPAARPRRLTGGSSPPTGTGPDRAVRVPDGRPPPPRPVVDRTQAWLAVALVAAVVVLVAVVSDAATVPPRGIAERPVVTTVITLSAVPDPRATEGPAPQDRQRVLSW